MNIENAKELLNKVSTKVKRTKVEKAGKAPGIGWEIGAYSVRGVSVAAPSITIMCLENSWVKTGLGLMATVLIIALLIIFKDPIKTASGYAPGVIPFAIFIVIALFFDTTAKTLLTVGVSGFGGSVISIPLHLKYLSHQKTEKSPELQALETIAERLK